MSCATSVGVEIVEQIAAREGVDPVDLDAPLYDTIDPEALDAILNGTGDQRTRPALHVKFTYHGYAVSVDGAGEVSIDKQPLSVGIDGTSKETGDV